MLLFPVKFYFQFGGLYPFFLGAQVGTGFDLNRLITESDGITKDLPEANWGVGLTFLWQPSTTKKAKNKK
jgi:hypothetical protein